MSDELSVFEPAGRCACCDSRVFRYNYFIVVLLLQVAASYSDTTTDNNETHHLITDTGVDSCDHSANNCVDSSISSGTSSSLINKLSKSSVHYNYHVPSDSGGIESPNSVCNNSPNTGEVLLDVVTQPRYQSVLASLCDCHPYESQPKFVTSSSIKTSSCSVGGDTGLCAITVPSLEVGLVSSDPPTVNSEVPAIPRKSGGVNFAELVELTSLIAAANFAARQQQQLGNWLLPCNASQTSTPSADGSDPFSSFRSTAPPPHKPGVLFLPRQRRHTEPAYSAHRHIKHSTRDSSNNSITTTNIINNTSAGNSSCASVRSQATPSAGRRTCSYCLKPFNAEDVRVSSCQCYHNYSSSYSNYINCQDHSVTDSHSSNYTNNECSNSKGSNNTAFDSTCTTNYSAPAVDYVARGDSTSAELNRDTSTHDISFRGSSSRDTSRRYHYSSTLTEQLVRDLQHLQQQLDTAGPDLQRHCPLTKSSHHQQQLFSSQINANTSSTQSFPLDSSQQFVAWYPPYPNDNLSAGNNCSSERSVSAASYFNQLLNPPPQSCGSNSYYCSNNQQQQSATITSSNPHQHPAAASTTAGTPVNRERNGCCPPSQPFQRSRVEATVQRSHLYTTAGPTSRTASPTAVPVSFCQCQICSQPTSDQAISAHYNKPPLNPYYLSTLPPGNQYLSVSPPGTSQYFSASASQYQHLPPTPLAAHQHHYPPSAPLATHPPHYPPLATHQTHYLSTTALAPHHNYLPTPAAQHHHQHYLLNNMVVDPSHRNGSPTICNAPNEALIPTESQYNSKKHKPQQYLHPSICDGVLGASQHLDKLTNSCIDDTNCTDEGTITNKKKIHRKKRKNIKKTKDKALLLNGSDEFVSNVSQIASAADNEQLVNKKNAINVRKTVSVNTSVTAAGDDEINSIRDSLFKFSDSRPRPNSRGRGGSRLNSRSNGKYPSNDNYSCSGKYVCSGNSGAGTISCKQPGASDVGLQQDSAHRQHSLYTVIGARPQTPPPPPPTPSPCPFLEPDAAAICSNSNTHCSSSNTCNNSSKAFNSSGQQKTPLELQVVKEYLEKTLFSSQPRSSPSIW